MTRKAAIILGHSHLSAMIGGLLERQGEANGNDPEIEYYIFDSVRLGADFAFSIDAGDNNFILNPTIKDMIKNKVPEDRDLIYISMFGGNAHNALTLLEHPRPFDFVLPENVNLPLIEGAEVVPYSYIRAFIKSMAEQYLLNTATLKMFTDKPVYHFESPPPIGNNEFVKSHLEGYFKSQSSEPKISPSSLRYKLWRLHSKIIKDYCDALGVNFIEVPKNTMDENGFLAEYAYGQDSTHAGPNFGTKFLENFEKTLGVKYDGWNWLF